MNDIYTVKFFFKISPSSDSYVRETRDFFDINLIIKT